MDFCLKVRAIERETETSSPVSIVNFLGIPKKKKPDGEARFRGAGCDAVTSRPVRLARRFVRARLASAFCVSRQQRVQTERGCNAGEGARIGPVVKSEGYFQGCI
jgi:hypothetical protein